MKLQLQAFCELGKGEGGIFHRLNYNYAWRKLPTEDNQATVSDNNAKLLQRAFCEQRQEGVVLFSDLLRLLKIGTETSQTADRMVFAGPNI